MNTAPMTSQADGPYEVHILGSKAQCAMSIWSLKTFFHNTSLVAPLVIHDDGNLDDTSIQLYRMHFPGALILTEESVRQNAAFQRWLEPYPNLSHLRLGADNLQSRRLLDFNFFARHPKIVVFDSDVLFLRSIDIIADFARNDITFISADSRESYYPVFAELPPHISKNLLRSTNASFWGTKTSTLDPKIMEDFLSTMSVQIPNFFWTHWWLEQTILALLLSQSGSVVTLDPIKHAISHRPITDETISHHFPGDGSRASYYRCGLRTLHSKGIFEKLGHVQTNTSPRTRTGYNITW